MDEILASIRRIIADDHPSLASTSSQPVETNERGDETSSDQDSSQAASDDVAENIVRTISGEPHLTAADHEEIAVPPATTAASPTEAPTEGEPTATAPDQEVFAAPPQVVDAATPEIAAESGPAATVPDQHAIAAPSVVNAAQPETIEPEPDHPETSPAALVAVPAQTRIEPASATPEPPPPRPAAEPHLRQGSLASEGGGVDSLLSRAATASVGDAFQALSHTVLSNNSRTLEDLVKDMLRPMLQGWLDDNLPPLVERLVRAEIERVARGRS